jgi:hypothetical protein
MKMLVGITTCNRAVYPAALVRKEPPNNATCHAASRETWIRDAKDAGIDVKFFFGRGADREPLEDEVFLDVDDSYDGLFEKVAGICRWADEHEYDFVMKIDIDSYVSIKNLLASEFREWDYTGRGWGLGYILSRKAAHIIGNQKERLSWAEDSHALKTLFAYGDVGPENVIRLYGDGRYVFLPNLPPNEIPLYDKSFVVVNPMTPDSMRKLHQTGSIASLVPFDLSKEDLWTQDPERAHHCSVFNAFTVRGEKCPMTYDEWVAMTPYDRQPYSDWMELVHACIETKQLDTCPSFEQWMGPIADRKKILNWASTINAAAIAKVKRTSEAFSDKGYAIGNQEFTVEGKQAYVNKGNLDEVSIIVTTFLRDGYLIPCLERIQMYLPDAKVIVVDDGIPSLKKDGFANYMPFDSGLSAKRNKAVRIARTKYVLLGSDDFDFGGLETRAGIEKLVKLLDENPDIDVAGGRVNNARYEALLEYKKGEYIREHCLITSSNKPTPVDLTVNYFLARTDVIAKFPWPDEMKIGGEHVCFFLDLKLKGRKVVFVPGVNINTFRVRNGADPRYESYRNRAHSLGHALMKKRYGIVDYIDMNGEVS